MTPLNSFTKTLMSHSDFPNLAFNQSCVHSYPQICQTDKAAAAQNSAQPANTAIQALRFRLPERLAVTAFRPKSGWTEILVAII
ncbi:hypothetical protein LA635_1757 [Erwinia amylovora LA635]|nr:hypothetical protein LA635_1757 [Erwinia amylovora LA635]CDK18747.1 hypothetical protein LA636_1755 [Erwinia amylovora LA636]CDK22117.1 hypothetical protein LA637_1757 [Erwinia amylovora LA637]